MRCDEQKKWSKARSSFTTPCDISYFGLNALCIVASRLSFSWYPRRLAGSAHSMRFGPLRMDSFTDGWSSEWSLEPCFNRVIERIPRKLLVTLELFKTHLNLGPQCPLHQN